MAGLRDEIARVTGWKPERVQDQCEGMVALLSATK
jgi:hypothetical protein